MNIIALHIAWIKRAPCQGTFHQITSFFNINKWLFLKFFYDDDSFGYYYRNVGRDVLL